MTRAELMRHALAQALRRVHVGAKKLKLDEETRWQIAGEAVEELRLPRFQSGGFGLYLFRHPIYLAPPQMAASFISRIELGVKSSDPAALLQALDGHGGVTCVQPFANGLIGASSSNSFQPPWRSCPKISDCLSGNPN